jgi:hypothetical protein
VAGRDVSVHDVRADEPSPARHENFHRPVTLHVPPRLPRRSGRLRPGWGRGVGFDSA